MIWQLLGGEAQCGRRRCSSQGTVKVDGRFQPFLLGDSAAVLRLDETLLRIENPLQIGGALDILQPGQARRRDCFRDNGVEQGFPGASVDRLQGTLASPNAVSRFA